VRVPPHLLNEHYDDRYFDVVNAIEEATHIYFDSTGILDLIADQGPRAVKEFRVGETGFGAGRLLVALLLSVEKRGISGRSIIYNSVELHPVAPDRMRLILDGFRREAGHLIDPLIEKYSDLDLARGGWHQLIFPGSFGALTLNLWMGEALEMVRALAVPCDTWFLDGHGPKKNPEIWRHELLMAIGEKTVAGGSCATFTVAGAIRRGLSDAGFSVWQRPGYGGKKAVLMGRKR
jgi:tRNA U34 5-methylaminomethyl-2-thiouridine-forming methyltransferase MnmC